MHFSTPERTQQNARSACHAHLLAAYGIRSRQQSHSVGYSGRSESGTITFPSSAISTWLSDFKLSSIPFHRHAWTAWTYHHNMLMMNLHAQSHNPPEGPECHINQAVEHKFECGLAQICAQGGQEMGGREGERMIWIDR